MGWTDKAIDVLKKVAAAGGSFSDAAEQLGVTRNAVAGKASREGIQFYGDTSDNPAVREKRSIARKRAWDKLTPAERERRLDEGVRKASRVAACHAASRRAAQ